MLAIAIAVVEARIAGAGYQATTEIERLRQAVAAEDRLAYDEPKNWFFPVRHLLGAALLRLGEAREAERVYREDLGQNPANGWSLAGLRDALRAQGRTAEAAAADDELRSAWKHADVPLTASAF